MAYKVNMEKAFDRIEWALILTALKILGFLQSSSIGSWLVSLLLLFLSFLNCRHYGQFASTRGIRQGDPLYRFLFIIGTELLS